MGKSRGKEKKSPVIVPSKMAKKVIKGRPRKKKHVQEQPESLEDNDPVLFGSDHDAEEEEEEDDEDEDDEENLSPEDIQLLLEPYSKDQLITFLADAAVDDSALLTQIRSAADRDVAHRKIFVRGLGWDVTSEILQEAFRSYGPIVDCNVVVDRATGRNKGFGFVLFATRDGASTALKSPDKRIGNRMASCQLASIGFSPSASGFPDAAQRRIYVSNVNTDASPEKLKAFFATFGEIESGPSVSICSPGSREVLLFSCTGHSTG
ncbi:hypothetical protein KSP40_PGU008536 [Platanthera guangdongensis]|uniref:RRM domain-containing protein n=1 Tax=Platanthera guangdongensis TaxID=2320717 RepID=A0ABR2LI55_9ASPA